MVVSDLKGAAKWVVFGLLVASSFVAPPGIGARRAQSVPGALPRLGSPLATSGSSPNYDEQIGLTFTDTLPSLVYNVTAVSQANADGYGPAYLLNGLTDKGYWYQVGLSWDWNPGTSPGTGFGMVYEVWDTGGNSIFPTDGGGGLQSISGTVNDGDPVQLKLNFTGSSVVMHLRDLKTGASSSVHFSAEGASTFAGLINPSNINGYFSGLMTEEYHASPYFGNVVAVNYSSSTPLSNGFLWADEFSIAPRVSVFYGSKFVSFANAAQIQTFATNGTTSYADAKTFITGDLTEQFLTLSYHVLGGGSGYGVPTLTYLRNGVQRSATLVQTATTYFADNGSAWQVSVGLPGGSANERWQTYNPASGSLVSSVKEVFYYFHQYRCDFGFNTVGGGTGFLPPGIEITSGAVTLTATGGVPRWVDAGTRYNYSATLRSNAPDERLEASGVLTGIVSGPVNATVTYFHQFGLKASYVLVGGGSPAAPTLKGTALAGTFSSPIANSTVYYLDSGTSWSVPGTLQGSGAQERWALSQSPSGTVSAPATVVLSYQHQYAVEVSASPGGAGTVSQPGSWQNAGASIELTQRAGTGWKFAYWSGAGTVTLNSTTIQVSAPVSETAVFYPGLTITAGSDGAVVYTFGNVTGTVPAGTSKTVYAGPAVTFSLSAAPSSFLYTFAGWSGSATGTSDITLPVQAPKSVTATFTVDVSLLGGVAAAAFAVVALALVAWSRRHRQST